MKTNPSVKKAFLACALTILSCPAASYSGEPNDYIHSRSYLGVVGHLISVDQSTLFNGKNYFVANSPAYEVDLIPRIDQGFGFGLMVGHREEAYAMELSYLQSNHNAFFGPASVTSTVVSTPVDIPMSQGSAVYQSINLDFKRYFLTELPYQPFINLGVSFPWIVVPDAAVDAYGSYFDLTLAGLGLNLGVGVEYYLSPNVSLMGGINQRWASFDQYKNHPDFPKTSSYTLLQPYGGVENNSGSGLVFIVGTSIGFQ